MGMYFLNLEGCIINGVIIIISVVQDLEFEYIMVNNDIVFVILQENNGVVVIDLILLEVNVLGLGFKDWFVLNIDVQEDGEVSFGKYVGFYGVYMLDMIVMYIWKEVFFFFIVNEGDVCEYFIGDDFIEVECIVVGGQDFDDGECLVFIEEVKVKDLSVVLGLLLEVLQVNGEIDDLCVINVLGDMDGDGQYEVVYFYGVCFFIIWDQNGLVVFDLGDDFE